jgi:hypothetical protein
MHIHESGVHESHNHHAIDVHVYNQLADQNHHDDAKVIDSSPAGIIKNQLNKDLIPVFAIFLFSFFVTVLLKQTGLLRYRRLTCHAASRYRHFVPFLRAPPGQ